MASPPVQVVTLLRSDLRALVVDAVEEGAARALRLHAAEQQAKTDGLVTPAELARIRKVHRSTIARWVAAGCPYHQQPGGRRFDPREVDQWLATKGAK